jgi:hypothetical protein
LRQQEADAEELPQEAESPETSRTPHPLWKKQLRPDSPPRLHGRPGEKEHNSSDLQSRNGGSAHRKGSMPPDFAPPPSSPRRHGRPEEERKDGNSEKAFPRRCAHSPKNSRAFQIRRPPEPVSFSPRRHGRPEKEDTALAQPEQGRSQQPTY